MSMKSRTSHPQVKLPIVLSYKVNRKNSHKRTNKSESSPSRKSTLTQLLEAALPDASETIYNSSTKQPKSELNVLRDFTTRKNNSMKTTVT